MEPVGVYKTLLNQYTDNFITPFIALCQNISLSTFISDKQKNRQQTPAVHRYN